jgi:hypothetical protein
MKELLVAALLAVVPTSSPCSTGVGLRSLEDLTRFADAIFIGRVEEVFEIEQGPSETPSNASGFYSLLRRSVPIAKVSVLRALKGVEKGDVVHYLAARRWTEDISTAISGETALFFLDRSDWTDERSREFRSELKQRTGASSTHVLSHHGRGRMPLRIVEDREYVTYGVIPPELPTIDGPDPEHESIIRSIRLDTLEAYLQGTVAAQWPHIRASNHTPLSPYRRWELEIWGDGFRWLHVKDPEEYINFERQIPPEVLLSLKKALKTALDHRLPKTLGQQGPDGSRRSLEIHTTGGKIHRLEIHTLHPELDLEERERECAVAVLELWSHVRGLFQTRRTLDARPYDRPCIEAWR